MNDLSHSALDNPAWSALSTTHAHLAQGTRLALRYDPAVGPFAGIEAPTQACLLALRALAASSEPVLLQSTANLPAVDGLEAERLFGVLQMIDTAGIGPVDERGIETLGPQHADAMIELARRTSPGPFARRTVEMGRYIGLRDNGRLVAMAGERMRFAGFVEISAVCVDDTHRGQGIAGRLMTVLRNRVKTEGDRPFLHVREDNASAIRLYRHLGFEDRRTFSLHRLTASASR
ncbi:GNAT family N-acetyltransferase [Burkholderia sp. Ac-20379]|uniref:GNAT family N-acetyltransferase n=1 Tax=Burkholderia sp. Ac-20379 TaxID=2703900 RepID=UPI00197D5D59|nr:GNAT family N-acetyltransferase [Burkholderia sp. Ac-20379]MBN3725580.1 GNAT family N-acetyltransferase [Burkholderia sp. Ac-20379]